MENTTDCIMDLTTKDQELSTFPTLPSSPWFPEDEEEQENLRMDRFVSNDVVSVIEIAVIICLCGVISASGLVANVINVIVFLRQGALSSSSNVSLLALAFADIGCLVPVFSNSVSYALHRLGYASMFLTARDFFETVVIWPHIMSMQIASWVTAYIAFERCISVLLPLRIKSLFSARKSALVTVIIALIGFASFLPTFLTQKIAKIVDPTNNTTGIVFMPTKLHDQIVGVSDIIHAIILRPLALLVVFICTQITIYRVKLSSSWRESMMAASSKSVYTVDPPPTNDHGPTPGIITKEARLIKMITAISIIFMVCNTPDILSVFVILAIKERLQLSFIDNVFFLIIAAQLCLESINSSINIVVYYRMSSMYRRTFRALMGRK